MRLKILENQIDQLFKCHEVPFVEMHLSEVNTE